MQDAIIYLLSLITVAAISVYLTHYFTVRRSNRERKNSLENEEAKRIEGMLQYQSKIQTSANLANTNQDHALGLLRESRAWFDANCISYLKEEPYKSFNFVLKLTSGYVADPVIFAKAEVNSGGDQFIFEQITELQEKLEAKLKQLRLRKV